MPQNKFDQDDIDATERAAQFEIGWFFSPLVYGDYPDVMKYQVGNKSMNQGYRTSRLPSFTADDKVQGE